MPAKTDVLTDTIMKACDPFVIDRHPVKCICVRLIHYNRILKRLNERFASEQMSSERALSLRKRKDLAEASALRNIDKLKQATCLDIELVIQDDPRGSPLKLKMSDKYKHLHDCFGLEGIVVP